MASGDPLGPLPDQDVARLGRSLQPRCDIGDIAGHERIRRGSGRSQHFAGVDPDPDLDRLAVPLVEIDVESGDVLMHLQPGPYRPERGILATVGQAEDGKDRVTDELLDLPPVALYDPSAIGEIAEQYLP